VVDAVIYESLWGLNGFCDFALRSNGVLTSSEVLGDGFRTSKVSALEPDCRVVCVIATQLAWV